MARIDADKRATTCVAIACRSLRFREVLEALMDAWGEGMVVRCVRSKTSVALLVAQQGALRYRFVCVRCGTSSGWFDYRGGVVTGLVAFDATLPPPSKTSGA